MVPSRARGRHVGTLRFRITALATAVVAVILVLAGVALVGAQRRQLTANLESVLRQRAHDVTAGLRGGHAAQDLSSGDGQDRFAQVTTPSGRVLASSRNLEGRPPVVGTPSGRVATFRTVGGLRIDNSEYRVLSTRVLTPDGVVVLHMGANLDDIIDSTHVLIRSLTIAIPAVVLLLAVLVWWLVGRTLRPVESIRAEVARMDGDDLHRRVSEPPGDDEIARLARTMNAMMDRVEEATLRNQRFVADASHELRSPLTRIRSELEVDAAHPETADLAVTQRSILDETIGLQRLVDELLHLARSDAGAGVRRSESLDLDDIVLRQGRRLRAEGRVVVDLTEVSAAQVVGDADQLGRVVRNLADNANRHAASRVTFTLVERAERAILTVTDDGTGIPPVQRNRVFERFTRLDGARNSAEGGTGLGLAITRDIVEAHGGTVVIDPEHLRGTRFVVTLPTVWRPA